MILVKCKFVPVMPLFKSPMAPFFYGPNVQGELSEPRPLQKMTSKVILDNYSLSLSP
jgi:hypothetical protein